MRRRSLWCMDVGERKDLSTWQTVLLLALGVALIPFFERSRTLFSPEPLGAQQPWLVLTAVSVLVIGLLYRLYISRAALGRWIVVFVLAILVFLGFVIVVLVDPERVDDVVRYSFISFGTFVLWFSTYVFSAYQEGVVRPSRTGYEYVRGSGRYANVLVVYGVILALAALLVFVLMLHILFPSYF